MPFFRRGNSVVTSLKGTILTIYSTTYCKKKHQNNCNRLLKVIKAVCFFFDKKLKPVIIIDTVLNISCAVAKSTVHHSFQK